MISRSSQATRLPIIKTTAQNINDTVAAECGAFASDISGNLSLFMVCAKVAVRKKTRIEPGHGRRKRQLAGIKS